MPESTLSSSSVLPASELPAALCAASEPETARGSHDSHSPACGEGRGGEGRGSKTGGEGNHRTGLAEHSI